MDIGLDGRSAGRRHWRHALILSLTALGAGLLLTGTSAWFLAAVALAGAGPAAFTFNFHIPAALVRLFALSRTAAKYGERLAGHRAALHDQVARRSALFMAMAASPATRRDGWQLARTDRLADFIDDVEDADYARLRAGLPTTGLAIALSALAAVSLLIAPASLIPFVLFGSVLGVVHGRVAPLAARDWQAARRLRRGAADRLGGLLSAVVPLQAERLWSGSLRSGFDGLAAAELRERAFRRRLALLDLVVRLAGPSLAATVLLAGWWKGLTGDGLLPFVFVAFAWLAFGEIASGLSRIAGGSIRGAVARDRLKLWEPEDAAADHHASPARAGADAGPVESLSVAGLARTAPDGRSLGGSVSFGCRRGEALLVVGASGCGKTTLLKQIAGWIPIRSGSVVAGGAAGSLVGATHLALHDAAVVCDTVRENLFAPTAGDDACWHALAAVELDTRMRAAGGMDGWITQDMLSLGECQRLALARAWLSDAPIILLDEPSEHLDAEQGRRIFARLRARFADRMLIAATHRPDLAQGDSIAVLDLDAFDGSRPMPAIEPASQPGVEDRMPLVMGRL